MVIFQLFINPIGSAKKAQISDNPCETSGVTSEVSSLSLIYRKYILKILAINNEVSTY